MLKATISPDATFFFVIACILTWCVTKITSLFFVVDEIGNVGIFGANITTGGIATYRVPKAQRQQQPQQPL